MFCLTFLGLDVFMFYIEVHVVFSSFDHSQHSNWFRSQMYIEIQFIQVGVYVNMSVQFEYA